MKCTRILLPLLVAFACAAAALASSKELEDDQADVVMDWSEDTVIDDTEWTDEDGSVGDHGVELQEDFQRGYEEETQYATDEEYIDDYYDYEFDYCRDAYEDEEPVEDYTYDSEDYDSEDYSSEDYDFEDYSSEDYDSEDYGSEDYDYEDYGYEDYDYENYGYEDYDYENYGYEDYGSEDYGCEYAEQEDGQSDESGDYGEYQYAENEETYGEYDYEAAYGNWEYEEENYCEGADGDVFEYETDSYDVESDCKLSAWLPSELLTWDDENIVRTLHRLAEEPWDVRRAVLSEYVESQGWEAIEFLSRFADIAGIDAFGLADDVVSASAMLGAFRLVELGEFDVDDGATMLVGALEDLSEAWIDEVTEITCEDAEELDGSASGWKVVNVVLDLTADSLNGVGEAFCGMSRRISSLKH